MTRVAAGSVIRQLGAIFDGGAPAGATDGQLLAQYVAGTGPGSGASAGTNTTDPAGEAAFAALVARHGPMVLSVCRQILDDAQHAEDAFQAVFLVLAKKAQTIRDPDLLGNWLYGVAVRTARCARQQIARRRRREEAHAMRTLGAAEAGSGAGVGPSLSIGAGASAAVGPSADQPAIDREQAEALHREVDRLPRAFRLPVVLCYFEGLSLDEAARRLRCPAGTVGSRLARAKAKLRAGLARRGVMLSSSAIAATLAPRSASASIPPLLCDSTTRAALAFAAAARHSAVGAGAALPSGSSPTSVAALAQEVLSAMLVHKLRIAAMTTVALAALAAGAGYLTLSLRASAIGPEGAPLAANLNPNPRPDDGKAARPQQHPRPAAASAPAPPANERMTVAGRVLGPDGKPVKGAAVDLFARPRAPWVGASDEIDNPILLGQTNSDADGRFRIDAARTGSNRVFEVHLLAAAPGFGLGWADLNPDAKEPTADIRLQPEQLLRARLVDVTGAPAKGVEIRVKSLYRPATSTDEGLDGPFSGLWAHTRPPEENRTWPHPFKSDDQGRIAIHGIGRGTSVNLGVDDLRFAQQDLSLESGLMAAFREKTLALQPSRIIEGRVIAADTGKPVPNAVVSASTFVESNTMRGYFTAKFHADEKGHFTMNPIAGASYTLGAFPTGGEPYLVPQEEFTIPRGAVKATHDIKMPRGVLIAGTVVEEGTGRPLAGSSIQYMPMNRDSRGVLSGWQAIVASGEGGAFRIAVPPGKGHLLVFGPTGDYVLGEIGAAMLDNGKPGGRRYRAAAIIPYEVKAGDAPHQVTATLRPGVTVRGRVEGPDGQTVTDAMVLTTLHIEPFNPFWRGDFHVKVRDGRFELHGLDPKGKSRISVLDTAHEWGATLDVSGAQAGEDLTIRLKPCGTAKVRFVDPAGRPVAGHYSSFELVMTPGPNPMTRDDKERTELAADVSLVANVDRKHYWTPRRTDAEGRMMLNSLIPGTTYSIGDYATQKDRQDGNPFYKVFTVPPGETIDLGDIRVDRPQSE